MQSTTFQLILIPEAKASSLGERTAQYCIGCHGQDGEAVSDHTPNLKGQNFEYLVLAIKAYQRGERKGDLAMLMRQNVSSLSDEEIEAVARYFASKQ